MPTYFIIEELSGEYNWSDFDACDLAHDYASDVHDIPEECIENIEIFTEVQKIEITLHDDTSVISEDWYHSLLQYTC